MKKILNYLSMVFFCFLLTVPLLVFSNPSYTPVAASKEVNPDESDIMQDLLEVDDFKNAYLTGDYVSDSTKDEFDVIQTLEWHLPEIKNRQTKISYSFYLYVWNKSGNGFANYNFEKAKITTFYSKTQKYDAINLTYINKTNDNKFIKYKLTIDSDLFFEEDLNSFVRHYPIIGLQISNVGVNSNTYRDYTICHEWIYDGFGNDVVVSYHSEYNHLELNVSGGTYLTESSSESSTAKNVMYYVWFNVPQKFEGEEYSLYSIHAQYYRYDFSNKLAALVDEYPEEYYESMTAAQIESYADANHNIARYLTHPDSGMDFWYEPNWPNPYQKLESHPFFIPIEDERDEVNATTLSSYFDSDKASILTGQSEEEVFKDIHYTNDKEPLNDAEFKEWNLLSYGDHHNGWDNFWSYILHGTNTTEIDTKNIECIQKINYAALSYSDSTLASEYLVSEDDATAIKNSVSNAMLSDESTYLFRFDTSVYDSKRIGYGFVNYMAEGQLVLDYVGYIATSYIGIIDFKIIDLTFVNQAKELLNLPVVHDPINIFVKLTPPPEAPGLEDIFSDFNSLKKILAIIVTVLAALFGVYLLINVFKLVNKKPKRNNRKKIINIINNNYGK